MKQLRVGLIGAGSFAESHLIPAILQVSGLELVSLMRRNVIEAKRIADKFSIPNAYGRVDALLEGKEVDAVMICSPDALHREHAVRAARAGKHIFCEKPLACTVEDCKAIMDACAKNNVHLMPGFMMRFHPTIKCIQEMVAQGQIGNIIRMRVGCGFNYPSNGSWRQQEGGVLFDLGSHAVDLVRFLTGQEICWVSASIDNAHHIYPAPDIAQLTLGLEYGGIATVDVSFCTPYHSRLELWGSRGYILGEHAINRDPHPYADMFTHDGVLKKRVRIKGNRYVNELSHFAQAILYPHPFCVDITDGWVATVVLEAAKSSSEDFNKKKLISEFL